ncbi:hypothetical protein ACHAWX_000241 [Stephanocyclus meneghinianus]
MKQSKAADKKQRTKQRAIQNDPNDSGRRKRRQLEIVPRLHVMYENGGLFEDISLDGQQICSWNIQTKAGEIAKSSITSC